MDSTITPPRDDAAETAARASIDRSVRWPVLFFFSAAALWLLAAIFTGAAANLKLIAPTLGESVAALAYPRLQAVHFDILVYGWCFNMAFGVMIWLVARLCRVDVEGSLAFAAAGKVWNLLVAIGSAAVLLGKGSGIEWLDFPRWVWPPMFLAFAVIAGKLFAMLLRRRQGPVFLSLWYILVALFAFPWLLLTAWILIFALPGAAVHGAAVGQWYISGLMFLFFIPAGLASTYYFVPKVTGNPVHSYGLALGGFWGLAALGGWTGIQRLSGGPLPVWMPAVSGAAVIVALVPLALIFINHKRTLADTAVTPERSPTLRFSYTAIWALLVFGVIGAVLSTLSMSSIANFTTANNGCAYAALLGFFSMAMFGAMVFITPRLTGCEWSSGKALRLQYWATTYGTATLVVITLVGGLAQGAAIYDPDASWSLVVNIVRPYAIGKLIAFTFLFIANLLFLRNLLLMILRKGPSHGLATMLHEESHGAASH